MDIRIKIDDGYLNPAFIVGIKFQVDIFSLYARAQVRLSDITKSLYNQIQTGMNIIIQFYEPKEGSKVYYENKMKVLSFSKKPASGSNPVDIIDVSLISAWYFDSEIKFSSYHGNFGEIVSQLVSSKTDYFNLDLGSTDDMSRYRYRLGETDQEFIIRMMKFGYKGNLPVYLYSDAKGNLKLRGVTDFVSESSQVVATTDSAEQTSSLPSSVKNYSRLRITKYKCMSDADNSSSKTTTAFTTSNFLLPTGSDEIEGGITLNNTENGNVQSYSKTPVKYNFKNWNLTPDDALAISIKENFEKNIYTYYVVAITPEFVFDRVDLGGKISLYLPYARNKSTINGKNVNLGEGEYIISHIDYIFKNNQRVTRFNLVQIAY